MMTKEEALNVLRRYQGKEYNALVFDDALDTAVEALEKEVTHGWISAKDRLPEAVGKECDKYLVYGRECVGKDYEDGEHEIFIGNFDYSAGEFGVWVGKWAANGGFDGDEFYRYPEVLAWQPLPEPYEEKEK